MYHLLERLLQNCYRAHLNHIKFIGIKLVFLKMLLQLENTNKENIDKKKINKLIAFAKENEMDISLLDDNINDIHLPGKPLTSKELTELIQKSRESGTISMVDGHTLIRNRNVG
jgi:23S rRNA pseudoU1915 N3-methylase RlmH